MMASMKLERDLKALLIGAGSLALLAGRPQSALADVPSSNPSPAESPAQLPPESPAQLPRIISEIGTALHMKNYGQCGWFEGKKRVDSQNLYDVEEIRVGGSVRWIVTLVQNNSPVCLVRAAQ